MRRVARLNLGKKDIGLPLATEDLLRRGRLRTSLIGTPLMGRRKGEGLSSLKAKMQSKLYNDKNPLTDSRVDSLLMNEHTVPEDDSDDGNKNSKLGSSLLSKTSLMSRYMTPRLGSGSKGLSDLDKLRKLSTLQNGKMNGDYNDNDEVEEEAGKTSNKLLSYNDRIKDPQYAKDAYDENSSSNLLKSFGSKGGPTSGSKGGSLSLSIDAPMNVLRRALLFQSAVLRQRAQMSRARQNQEYLQTIGK